MAKRLILNGIVQGVCCRHYCQTYARKMGIRGAASNMANGTVEVLLDTADDALTARYISALKNDPQNVRFYGSIDSVSVSEYTGILRGDYMF